MWRPLLDGAEAAAARAMVHRIAEAIAADPPATAELGNGAAGAAVLFAYLARDDARWRPTCEQLLERAEDQLATLDTPSLFHGFCGLGWAGDHIRGVLGEPDLEVNSELDAALESIIPVTNVSFDLIGGLVGIGVYAHQRGAARCVELVVDRLHDAARDRFWLRPEQLPQAEHARWPTGRWDLGLAHGTPGVIAWLARLAEPRARALCESAIEWLLAHRRSITESGEVAFPAFAAPGVPAGSARSGWCYGDAAIALALARAGRTELALELARHAMRRPREHTGVEEGTFCHGAAGLAQIYGRLHAITGDGELAGAARYWLAETLRLEHGAAQGMLGGAAGVALVLHAATSGHAPDWDRAFLLA
ncbi:MAG TPA: lanthionine synthetase LanC family protein [Kofleriaceae bacterium]